jgi:DNA-binding transcriptional LysR family regulator
VPLIVFRPGYGVRQLIESTLHKAGIVPAITHEVGFLATATWMAASGLGVTILPTALAQLEAWRGIALRPLSEPPVMRTIALVTKKGRSLSPSCRLFIDMLTEDLRAQASSQIGEFA